METKEKKEIRLSSWGGGQNQKSLTIANLSDEEHEKVFGCIQGGMWWIRVENGELKFVPNYKPLPSPIEDSTMFPFWRKATQEEMKRSYSMFETQPIEELHSSIASITIHSWCGYYYTPERYKIEAENLISYGFECLRSRRGEDSTYWEIWLLPSLIFAKGNLQMCIQAGEDDKKKLALALEFLRKNSTFGSLDVSVQRLAMQMPD